MGSESNTNSLLHTSHDYHVHHHIASGGIRQLRKQTRGVRVHDDVGTKWLKSSQKKMKINCGRQVHSMSLAHMITECCVPLRWESLLLGRWGRAEKLKISQHDPECYVYMEHGSKKRNGGFFQLHVDNKVSIFKNSTAGQWCLVSLLDVYFRKLKKLTQFIVAYLTNLGMMVLGIQCNHEGNMYSMRW